MGEVQVVLHVEQRVPPSPDQVHHLPVRDDILRCLGVARYRCALWYAPSRFLFRLEPRSTRELTFATDYLDQQKYVEDRGFNASIDNNDFIGIFSYNIFVGVYVATIFGAAFFFDLFWPERHESGGVKMAWRICSLLTIPFVLSAALGCTIILATHEAHITGVDSQLAAQLLAESQPHEPLVYKHNPRGIASVVFVWLGFVFTVAS